MMKLVVAGTVMAVVMMASGPAVADVKAGVDAWQRGDYAKAVAEWRDPAAAGDADAEFNLAQAYKLGRGVPADPAQAETLFRKAAAQGHLQAGDNLGMLLFERGQKAEALPWLEKSVARGEPRAQLVLGTMLFNGDGVPRDPVRAYALVNRAYAQGLPQATKPLAQMDQFISVEDRQKGLELARQYQRTAGNAAMAAAASTSNTGRQVATAAPSLAAKPKPSARPAPPAAAPAAAKPAAVASSRPAVRVATSAGAGWRIQLGAFGDAGNARALWQRLRSRVGALRPLAADYVRAGTVTRLQAGPFASSAEASRACAAVKAAGNACLPVAP